MLEKLISVTMGWQVFQPKNHTKKDLNVIEMNNINTISFYTSNMTWEWSFKALNKIKPQTRT